MPPYCAISSCRLDFKRRSNSNKITFHRFPRDKDLAKKWGVLCRRKTYINFESAIICSNHFQPEDYVRDLRAELLGVPPKRRLKPDAIPSQNLVSEYGPRVPCLCNLESLGCDVGNITMLTDQKSSKECRCGSNTNRKHIQSVSEVICKKENVDQDQTPSISEVVNKSPENHYDINSKVNISESDHYIKSEPETAPTYIVVSTGDISPDFNNFNDTFSVSEHPQDDNISHITKRKCCEPFDECTLHKRLKLYESRDKWHSDRYEALASKFFQMKNQLLEYPSMKARNEKTEMQKLKMFHNLSTVFSKSQIDFLLNSFGRGRWSDEDMYQAIILKRISNKTYNFLTNLGFPFPSPSRIKKWRASHKHILKGKSIEELKAMLPIRGLKRDTAISSSDIDEDSENFVSSLAKETVAEFNTRNSNSTKSTNSDIQQTAVESDASELGSMSSRESLSALSSVSLNHPDQSSLLSEEPLAPQFELVEMKFEVDETPSFTETSNISLNYCQNNKFDTSSQQILYPSSIKTEPLT